MSADEFIQSCIDEAMAEGKRLQKEDIERYGSSGSSEYPYAFGVLHALLKGKLHRMVSTGDFSEIGGPKE